MSDREKALPEYENNCYVCGPENPVGLRVPFTLVDDLCVGEFTPSADHGGWKDVTHGGVIFSLLDDVMANWLYLRDDLGHTARCEIRYRAMLPAGTTVRLEGWQESRKGRVAMMAGRAIRTDTGEVVAECEARFMLAR